MTKVLASLEEVRKKNAEDIAAIRQKEEWERKMAEVRENPVPNSETSDRPAGFQALVDDPVVSP